MRNPFCLFSIRSQTQAFQVACSLPRVIVYFHSPPPTVLNEHLRVLPYNFWNSVVFLDVFLPRKRKTRKQGIGEPQRKQEKGIPIANGSVHVRAGQQALEETFLGRWNCENNWFTQIFCKEIYLSGWEFKIKSLRGTLCKLSKWTKTIIIRKKSFERKLILMICFSREYISIIM